MILIPFDTQLIRLFSLQKAGRDPSMTTFMIDKSPAIISAVNQLSSTYILCIFHMKQDIDRRLNKHIEASKKPNSVKSRIQIGLTKLRMIDDKETFQYQSRKFKSDVMATSGLKDPFDFVKYYATNWEPCADKWAAFGRLAFRSRKQDTNNLIEAFFRQLRNRYCRKKKTRLDEHLKVLVEVVIPNFVTGRLHKQLGIEKGKNQRLDGKMNFQVEELVRDSSIYIVNRLIGKGFMNYVAGGKGEVVWFCLADLSCSCRKLSGPCIHIESVAKHLANCDDVPNYGILLEHARYLKEYWCLASACDSVGNTGACQPQEVSNVLHEWEKRRSGTYTVDPQRKVCSCSVFSHSKICSHLLATLPDDTPLQLESFGFDADSKIPMSFFHRERFGSGVVEPNNESTPVLHSEGFTSTPHNVGKYSIFNATKFRHKGHTLQLRQGVSSHQQEAVQKLFQEFVSRLDDILPAQLENNFTPKDLELEKRKKYSRRSSDRIMKPLYPNHPKRAKKR